MARTRDPEVDKAIYRSTLEELSEKGYGALTIEGVAARAAVARSTVYRRYDGIEEMVQAAVASQLSLTAPEQSLEPRQGWRHVVEALRAAMFESGLGLRLLAALLVAEEVHPDLLSMWRARVVSPRVEMIAARFDWSERKARRLGELALGGLIAAYVSRGDVSELEARELADLLWAFQEHLE